MRLTLLPGVLMSEWEYLERMKEQGMMLLS